MGQPHTNRAHAASSGLSSLVKRTRTQEQQLKPTRTSLEPQQFLQTLHSTTMKVLFASAMALCLLSATLAQGPMGGPMGGGMLPLMMMRGGGMDGIMPLLMMSMMGQGGQGMGGLLPLMMMQGGMGGQDAGAGGMVDP